MSNYLMVAQCCKGEKMTRPTNKKEIIYQSDFQFKTLESAINSLSKEEREKSFLFSKEFLSKKKEEHWKRDKNLRDVLMHLYEWHILLINWLKSNQDGIEISFIPKPFTWKTHGEMNNTFLEKNKEVSFEDSLEKLKSTHVLVMEMLDTFSDEQLFTKKRYSWAGTGTLASFFIANTSSHYLWANKKIKVYIKQIKKGCKGGSVA